MNAVKNRAPRFSRPENIVEKELRMQLVAYAGYRIADRLGGIQVNYLSGSKMETEIFVWIDADPIPRLLNFSLPFSMSFAETVAHIIAELEKVPAP